MTEDNEKKEKVETPSEYNVAPLSTFEFLLYLAIWSVLLFSGCFKVYQLGYNKSRIAHFVKKGILTPTYFGLYKSLTFSVWNNAVHMFLTAWPYITLYLVISKILRSRTTPKIFMIGCVVFSMYVNYHASSWKFVGMQVSIFTCSAIAGLLRSKTLVWIIGIASLYWFRNVVAGYPFFIEDYIFKLAFPYTFLLITRAISVGLTISDAPKFTWTLILEMMFYFWYLPAIIGSRMMTIREFVDQIYKPCVVENWRTWFGNALRVPVYLFCWSIVNNLVQVQDVLETHDLKYINQASLLGAQLFYGIHFYMIFVVLYKTVFLLTQLDGFLTADGPECIAHISLYSRMWRNFDTGMHLWFKDHVFRPIVKLGPFHITRHFAILACFLLTVLFHGLYQNHLIWIVINIFQFYAEKAVKYLYLNTWIRSSMEKRFSPINMRRILGLAGGLSFQISVYGFSTYQFSTEVANLIFLTAFKPELNYMYHKLIIVFLMMYTHAQISLSACEYTRKRKLKIS